LFVGLQYLRAYAALLVVFFHAAVNAQSGFIVGEAGVDIFFVLSGFLMWRITNEQTAALAFLRNRIRRIVPVYWIASLLVFVLAELGLTSRIVADLGHLLASLFFIPYKGPGGVYPILIVGWTLNYEMFFMPYSRLALVFAASTSPWFSQLFSWDWLASVRSPTGQSLRNSTQIRSS